jgi:lysophospholipase L1-like esterase
LPRKKVIACLGDSMTAFWGQEMPELFDAFSEGFPDQEFELHNYGVSGTRAEYGNYRITHEIANPFGTGHQKCLSAISPDLVIVESFAYNHRLDGLKNIPNYKSVLGQLIQTIKNTTPAKIVFLVTIPPDKDNFLDHIPTLKYVSLELRREWAEGSDHYLKAAIEFATHENLPFANVYQKVMDKVSKGVPLQWFIDQNDHIHPSRYTYRLTAEEIVRVVKDHHLLQ